MGPDSFIRVLADEIVEGGLFPKDDRIVVAVSGGPDSMALLHALEALSDQAGFSLTLHIAHLDHRLRGPESEADAAFVQGAADALHIPCTIERCHVAALAAEQGVSVEESARRERYRLFERVCRQWGAQTVALGHHADDNAETILHRVLRGTGLRGLAGIPRSRPISPGSAVRVVRPLLGRTRAEILSFLDEAGIPFREDRSNQSNEPMRNRIRNVLLPQIEDQINPQVREALLRLAEQAGWVEEYFRQTAQRTYETLIISRTDQTLVLNAASLARKSRIVQTELVRRAIASFQTGQQDLGFAHIVAVLDLIADPGSGKQVHLPAGMTATKRYDRLILALPTPQPRETIAPEVAVHVPGVTRLPVRGLEIQCQVETIAPGQGPPRRDHGDRNQEWADFDEIHLPLVVRARRSGDRFWPLGAPGSKKVAEFLIDAKVDPARRDRVVVLCDQLGPVWIVGHRLDERVKLTRQTRRILKMQVRPISEKPFVESDMP